MAARFTSQPVGYVLLQSHYCSFAYSVDGLLQDKDVHKEKKKGLPLTHVLVTALFSISHTPDAAAATLR
jgi:hypothetical protein